MSTGRATLLLNSAAYVRMRFGEDGHKQVLKAQPQLGFSFSGSLPQGARIPVEHVVLYMETARALLAPEESGFFRDLGRFAAEQDRQGGLGHMVLDRDTLVRMLRTLWRAYFDTGSFEVLEKEERSFTARVADFAGHPALCERISGVADAHFKDASVEHVRCVFRGDSSCDWSLRW